MALEQRGKRVARAVEPSYAQLDAQFLGRCRHWEIVYARASQSASTLAIHRSGDSLRKADPRVHGEQDAGEHHEDGQALIEPA